MHAVGGVPGLYLQCLPPIDSETKGSKQWLYRAMIGGKLRWIGLGGYPAIPAKNARESPILTLAAISIQHLDSRVKHMALGQLLGPEGRSSSDSVKRL